MRDFRDAKAMAPTLREALKPKSVSLTHSESLGLVAKMLGYHDWNELSARIQSARGGAIAKPATIIDASFGARTDVPTVALRDIVFFPQMLAPLFVGREATKRALERAMAGDQRILAVTQRRSNDDNPTATDLYGVGVIARVMDFLRLDDGTVKVLLRGSVRATILHLIESPYLSAEIAPIEDLHGEKAQALALLRAVREKLKAQPSDQRPICVLRPLVEHRGAGHVRRRRCPVPAGHDRTEAGNPGGRRRDHAAAKGPRPAGPQAA
jgi:ATP-dependent Lon protease